MTDKDLKILCTKSGNRCALPNCRKILVVDGTEGDTASFVAEKAHIKGEKPNAARYDANMTDKERDAYQNRILLCPSCHKIIDDQIKTYSVEHLHKIKDEHEAWVIKSLSENVASISFVELNVVTKYLLSNQVAKSDSLALIAPKDKIKKNGLSASIEQMILIGMTQVTQVRDYVISMNNIDSNFVDRLIKGFVDEYMKLKRDDNESGDSLFNRLLEFSFAGSSDFKQRAAGLSVLVYLFEKCEVFEK